MVISGVMRVIKRRKGNADYYYLQHSYRREGKVNTKERYLGKEIPNNIEEIKKKLLHDTQEKFMLEKLEKIRSDFQKQWKQYPESAKQREKQELAITFTYNTNAIEGSKITLEETRAILEDQIAPNKPLRDIKETEAHAKLFLEMLKKEDPISRSLLLKWHKEMFKETKADIAGKFRTWPVSVGPSFPPHWSKIEKSIAQLMAFINKSSMNPVEIAIRAHYIFVKIHPYGDGNGRIGRLLMNYILWKNGYPMFVTENTKKKAYYESLEKSEEGFRNYLMGRYIATQRKRLIS
jgi:Fic family protein